MKKVCFYCADQNPHRDKSRGITVYTEGLIEALQKSGAISLSAVASKSSAGVPEDVARKILPFRTDHVPGRLLADHLHPFLAGQVEADLWHYPKGFLPLGRQVSAPKIGTIADTILQYYADRYPRERSAAAYAYWIGVLKNSIAHFDLIITISEFSKREITAFAERYKLRIPPIAVSYVGVDDFSNSLPPANRPRDYVVHIASKQPHKGTRWLLQTWRDLQRAGVSLPLLRIVGPLDLVATEMSAELRNIEICGAEKYIDLLHELGRALAVLLPSEIEGFGIPAVEGYLAGAPVAYVKETAVEEVLGKGTPGGFHFDRDSFRQALDEVLQMSSAQVEQKKQELREHYSWNQCAGRTLAAYNQVLNHTRPT